MPNANQVLPLVGDRPADCVRQRPGADETECLTLVGTRVLQEERAVDVAVLTHHGRQRTADRVELHPGRDTVIGVLGISVPEDSAD